LIKFEGYSFTGKAVISKVLPDILPYSSVRKLKLQSTGEVLVRILASLQCFFLETDLIDEIVHEAFLSCNS